MKSNKPDNQMSTSKSANVRLNVNQKPPQDKELETILEDFRLFHDVTCSDDITEQTKITIKKLASLLTQAHNSAIEEMIEALGDVPDDIDNYGGEPRGVYTERAELRQKLEGLRK